MKGLRIGLGRDAVLSRDDDAFEQALEVGELAQPVCVTARLALGIGDEGEAVGRAEGFEGAARLGKHAGERVDPLPVLALPRDESPLIDASLKRVTDRPPDLGPGQTRLFMMRLAHPAIDVHEAIPLDALQGREDPVLRLSFGGAKAAGGIHQRLAEVEDDRLHHRLSKCRPLLFRIPPSVLAVSSEVVAE